jgi:hypothetical protein
MSLVGAKAAVVSLGMSCQTTLQIDDHRDVFARALGEHTLKPSSMPFDNIVCHPASAAKMLRTDTFFPPSKDQLKILRGALWTDYNVYFRHECTLRKSRPLEYLRGTVNLARGYRDLASKFTHLAEKFCRLWQLERLIFVISNTQNDLTEYRDEVGIEDVISTEAIEQLCDATDSYFGWPCEYIFVTYESRVAGTTERPRLATFKLVPDASEWAGDHAQWKALWTEYLRASPASLARTHALASCRDRD